MPILSLTPPCSTLPTCPSHGRPSARQPARHWPGCGSTATSPAARPVRNSRRISFPGRLGGLFDGAPRLPARRVGAWRRSAAVNILLRIVDLALEADRRHVLLKLRAELGPGAVERAALKAEASPACVAGVRGRPARRGAGAEGIACERRTPLRGPCGTATAARSWPRWTPRASTPS